MARDYLIIHVNIWDEKAFKKFHKYAKMYDDENLKTLTFPNGTVSSVELLRPEDEE